MVYDFKKKILAEKQVNMLIFIIFLFDDMYGKKKEV